VGRYKSWSNLVVLYQQPIQLLDYWKICIMEFQKIILFL